MGLPRSKYVKDGQEGVYHCFSRCVRRAFLCGYDTVTNRDFSHRKEWLVDRLRHLAAIFAIEVCAYAVMENHYHTILRTRPDIVATWSDEEVATRWLTLFPQHRSIGGTATLPTDEEIHILTNCPERIAQLRKRLCSLSWFMGRLNEFIARAANKEDKVKGRFWESRFKCQALLDEAAIAACMVYVDLNPIRSGLAATPEGSDFTSIQERIRAWQKETEITDSISAKAAHGKHLDALDLNNLRADTGAEAPKANHALASAERNCSDHDTCAASWLCPISSNFRQRGILQLTAVEYFSLVDQSGRMIRSDKPGAIDANLQPILLRIGANPDAWMGTISRFGSKFRLAAGMVASLRNFGNQLGRQWLKGVGAARMSFAAQAPRFA